MMPERVVVISFNSHDASYAPWHFFTRQIALCVFKKSLDTKFLVAAFDVMPHRVVVVFASHWAFSIFGRNIPIYTQIYVQICRTEFIWLQSVVMTLNYCTSPVASSCHSIEPAVLWKNSQYRSRVCFEEAVTVMHSGFFEPSTAICIQVATNVWWKAMQTLNVWANIVQ